MNFASRPPIAAIVCFAGASITAATASAQAPVPDPLDVQALKRGEEAIAQQKYQDAVKEFQGLIAKYPQSPTIPQAIFRLGYAFYLLGDYDKAVENFQKASTAKGAQPEIIELALSLTPQVIAAKASKLKPEDPARDAALNDAIKQFDIFLQRFPNSEEAESANMGKALALLQLKKYEEAAQALRVNLQKFPQSESIQDSQFTLALILGADGATALSKATAPDPAAMAKLEEGAKLLGEIIAKRNTAQGNLAMINDAQFQLGEMLNARASFTDAKKKDEREKYLKGALDAYRGVYTKEQVIAAQKQRIEQYNQRRIEALKRGDVAGVKRMQRQQDKEQEKLATFEQRADQTATAKIRSGQIFFQMGKLDEARVLLAFAEPFAEIPEDKKNALYFITMSYALQSRMDKAVERYNAFQAAHKGDPIAENLQLAMAGGFLSKDPKIFDAQKAIEFCKEGIQIYPKGRFTPDLLNVQASALIGLKQYDEALALLKEFIAGSPPKELAAAAEFNLALIYKDTGKLDEALKTFREIRDKYAGTEQAEQASYWLGEMGLAVDPKQAIIEIKDFIQKHPDSDLAPQALFALARGQVAAGQLADALITFRDLPKKFPKSEPAPFTYFERAKIYANQQKYDECLAVMREFIAEYPDNPAQFQAHDFMAQILASQQKGMESIAIYEDFAKKFAGNPAAAEALLKLSSLWRGYAEQQGPILAQSPEKRTAWAKGVENSLAAVDQIVEKYPESPALALALGNALEIQKSRVRAKLITEADLEKYFGDLATKAEGKPGTQSKIQMTLAAYVSDKDKGKALGMIEKVFDEKLKYAPADLDLYGESLIEAKKYDETIKIYKKIASDYPIPGGVDPTKAPRDIQEAQAIALAGEAKALQGKGEKEASAAKYLELEKNYPWSPKMLEVHYGIALNLHEQGQDEEAIKRLLEVVKAMKAPAKLRADSLLLLGKIHESNKRFDQAIDNYIKIATFYSGVPDAAAEGLWRGAQLLEKQASGEIPRPTPPPRSSASPAPKGSPAPKAEAKPATAKQ